MMIEFDMLDAPFDWFIAFGSNLGDSRANLASARAALGELGEVIAASPVYRSAPMYELDQPTFYNAVVWLRSALAGEELLEQLRIIEQRFGRVRDDARRYGPRSLDLDIVAGMRGDEEVVYNTPNLCVPHERMQERRFVLQPLVYLAPNWNHPRLAQTAKELLESLGDDDSLQIAYQPEEWA